jgi:hypothetical protein
MAVFENREASQEPKVTGEILGKLVFNKFKEFECGFVCANRDGWMFSGDVRKSRGRERNSTGSIIVHASIMH